MINDFLAYLRSYVGKAIYVWGAQGETNISEEWIRRRENNEENNTARVLALWNKLKQAGVSPITAFDCSGLIMHYLQNLKGIYKTDLSSAGLYRECHILARNELTAGDLVFRHNGNKIHHVGIYVGKGMVIECKGRDEGVVERDIDEFGRGYWNRYGRLPALSHSVSSPTSAGSTNAGSRFAVCGGGSVNLRAGMGTEHNILAVMRKGDRLLALAGTDNWCPVSAYVNGRFLSGYMSEKYVEVRD